MDRSRSYRSNRTKSHYSKREKVRRKTRRSYSLTKTIGIAAVIAIFVAVTVSYSVLISSAPKQVIVIIQDGAGENLHLGFSPAKITIVIGVNNTVMWKNEDNDWHTAHSNIPEFNSGLIAPGASFTHVFEHSGTFPYHCDPHPWMTGLVIVESSSQGIMIQSNVNSGVAAVFASLDRILQSI